MNRIHTALLGATALMATTAVAAQAQSPQLPNSGEVVQAPAPPAIPPQNPPQSRPLFTIGGVEGHVWAPVQQPYDARVNRPLAEVPLWDYGN